MRVRGCAAAVLMMMRLSIPVLAAQAGWGKGDVKEGWGSGATAKKASAKPEDTAKASVAPHAKAAAKKEAPSAAPVVAPPVAAAMPGTPLVFTAPSTGQSAPVATAPAETFASAASTAARPPAVAQQAAPPPAASPAAPHVAIPITGRWLDLQTATAGARYREIETSAGVQTAQQMQTRVVFKGRVKLDRGGNYSVNVGLATGNSITGGWNTTGVGTGVPITNLYLKQLYFSAVPTKGVELQYGGLTTSRGENTEITSYDDDLYLVGERATVKRPRQWFFDEVTLTQAYLGDKTTPGFAHRYDRLDEANYHQILFGKKIGKQIAASFDYTDTLGVRWMRGAITYKRPLTVVDTIRFEEYGHADAAAGAGYSIFGEKAFGKRAAFGGGWASIDPNYGGLNGDRYNKGRRLFATGSFTVIPEIAVSGFFTRALANDYAVANATRLDLIVTYNVLRSLQRTGLF